MAQAVRPAPVRTCVACRTERPKRELVRVVRTPGGSVAIDPSGRLAGRGAYLCNTSSCWATALKKHSLERALEASLPPDVRAQLAAGETLTIEGGIRGS